MTEQINQRLTSQIYSIIKWSCCFLLCGTGFLHFTSDQPYQFLLDVSVNFNYAIGDILILSGFLSVVPKEMIHRRFINILYISISVLLLFHSFGTFVKAGFVPEQLIEHSLQIALPVLFLLFYNSWSISLKSLYNLLGILVAFTFIGHGIYALGINYIPGNFLEMTSKSLHLSNENSRLFLFIIGIFDLAFSAFLFIPKIRNYFIWYFIFWGLITSFARIYYVIGEGITTEWLTVNLPNTICRLPHGLIPIALYILLTQMEKYPHKKLKLSSGFQVNNTPAINSY